MANAYGWSLLIFSFGLVSSAWTGRVLISIVIGVIGTALYNWFYLFLFLHTPQVGVLTIGYYLGVAVLIGVSVVATASSA